MTSRPMSPSQKLKFRGAKIIAYRCGGGILASHCGDRVGTMSLRHGAGWQAGADQHQSAQLRRGFVLYDFSDAGAAATAVNKELTTLYSQAAEDAYRIFSADLREEGLKNVRYLNDHVNEAVTVEPALYKALSLLVKYVSLYAYLAPAYAEYDRVFLAESDAEAARYHPYTS